MLPLLMQEDHQRAVHVSLNPEENSLRAVKVASAFALKERERFRKTAILAGGMTEEDLPHALKKDAKGRWLAPPETFGDVLCESAQLLALLGGSTTNLRQTTGWQQGQWHWATLPEKEARKKKRKANALA